MVQLLTGEYKTLNDTTDICENTDEEHNSKGGQGGEIGDKDMRISDFSATQTNTCDNVLNEGTRESGILTLRWKGECCPSLAPGS